MSKPIEQLADLKIILQETQSRPDAILSKLIDRLICSDLLAEVVKIYLYQRRPETEVSLNAILKGALERYEEVRK